MAHEPAAPDPTPDETPAGALPDETGDFDPIDFERLESATRFIRLRPSVHRPAASDDEIERPGRAA